MKAQVAAPAVSRLRSPRVDVVLIALFLAIIATPGLGLLLGVDRSQVSEAEMRRLTEFPEWSWQRDALATWPDRFERYFKDRFAFRNALIRLQAGVLWHGLHTSSTDTVIAGKGDWLFYADDGGIQDYVQSEPFSEVDLQRWQLTLERIRDWLASRGTRFLFVLAPDKQMIYPELMPASLHRLHNSYRADQLLAYMRAHSTVEILDLRPAILEAKPHELLYHRYDTHWNDRGALIGYQQIAMRLERWFPEIQPLQRSDFVTSPAAPSGDKTTMLGLVDQGKVTTPGLVPRLGWSSRVVYPANPDPYGEDGTVVTEVKPGTGLRAVMFRDSFSSRLIPFLSEHFSRILYQWQNDFDPDLVRREHPDVVIQEMVGRHFINFVPTPELVPDPETTEGTGSHGGTGKRRRTE
jgi:hypothetical protein